METPKRKAKCRLASGWICLLPLLPVATLRADPLNVSYVQPTGRIEAYDFVEVTANVEKPDVPNPFTGASLTGSFGRTSGGGRQEIAGFCDSEDGTVFRVRFMPVSPGDYSFTVTYTQSGFTRTESGTFQVSDGHRRGPVRVDPDYPWHFIWEGTGEHYFFNGTTAHFLMGWSEDRIINFSLERLHGMKINRVRALLAGAISQIWGEPVVRNNLLAYSFTTNLRPWVASNPINFDNPGIDFERFNVGYWQKWDRMLRFARDRDMIISVVLDISTHRAQPAAGSEDERRYIRYAIARLGAYSNVTWDLGDDIDAYRDAAWMHETGTFILTNDPYRHLATCHPMQDGPQDRASEWFSFTSIQNWSRHQHALMLAERETQKKTGRIIPQVNEEYGYEDHYPFWSERPDANSADTLRHMAWEIAMAGAYGTTGETPKRGTGVWPNTGGGYVNGRGDDTMVMLKGYQHLVEFFTSFEWWKTEPHDELVSDGAFCLASPGEIYAVYLPKTGDYTVEHAPTTVTIQIAPGTYSARWFDAFTGEVVPLKAITVTGPSWTSPQTPGWLDWALLLERQK